MIIFIRHAERGDNQLPMKLSEISYDPPIIDSSKETISKTVDELTSLFEKEGVKRIQIISSKFLRCLMTAKGLEEGFKNKGVVMKDENYWLEDRICEYFREDWFQKYPLESLIYQTGHLSKYIPSGINYKEKKPPLAIPFPENYVMFHNRVIDFKKSLNYPEKGTCILVVTHGFVVRELCFHMNQVPHYQNEVKYCGYAAFVNSNKGDHLLKAKL